VLDRGLGLLQVGIRAKVYYTVVVWARNQVGHEKLQVVGQLFDERNYRLPTKCLTKFLMERNWENV
jgi:hypothetical protein